MTEVPAQLISGLSAAEHDLVQGWWQKLPEDTRSEVATLWDKRQDECFFGVTSQEPDTAAPKVIGGRFVPRDDAAGWAEWHEEYFKYLLNHPEITIHIPHVIRTFFIGCSHHAAVRTILESGRVPADFRCLIGSSECPFRLSSCTSASR
jgi:hypothetical protein